MDIVLYSTGCPRCNVLEKKLMAKRLPFEVETDESKIMELGYTSAPILSVDGTVMEFTEANTWLNGVQETALGDGGCETCRLN